jgi:hypothetical protein
MDNNDLLNSAYHNATEAADLATNLWLRRKVTMNEIEALEQRASRLSSAVTELKNRIRMSETSTERNQ